jgi:hypothetical protein
MSVRDEVSELQTIEQLRQALKRSHAERHKLKHSKEELVEAVYRAAKEAALASGLVKHKPPTRDKRKLKSEVALVHLTDWQLGKRTVSYNPHELNTRIQRFVDKVISITDIQRRHHPVESCVVMLGGDMVEGIGIFPGQAYEIDVHLFEQLFMAAAIMERTLLRLADYFPAVHVVCEYGNHGRLGRKGDMPVGDNIDRMAYKIVQDRLPAGVVKSWQGDSNWYQVFNIGEYKALLVHGDEIKSWGGNVPAYGILRKVNAWAGGVIEDFHDCYMGHWHSPMTLTMSNGGRIFVTGSPESHNEYAREFVAATNVPSQRLHYVDPAKGRVAAEYVIWLD